MKKRTIFLMVLMLLVSLFVVNAHNVYAAEINPTVNTTDGSTIVSTADGGVVHVKDLKQGDEIEFIYSEGIQTSADTIIHIKGHVTEIYRSRLVVYAGDEVLYDDQGYFFAEDKSESKVKLRLQDNYFTYHGNLDGKIAGKTITKIKFQIYTTNRTENRIGVFHLLGIHFDTNPTYDGFASLGGESVEPEQPTPEEPVDPTPSEGYVFNAESGATGSNNQFVMSGTRATLRTSVDMAVASPTYISIRYTAENIENFDIKANVVAGDGTPANVTVGDKATVTTAPWNKTEFVVGEEYTTLTIQTGNYLDAYTGITSVDVYVRGDEGSTFTIFAFAVTTDGNHGFDAGEETPEEPENPVDGLVVKSAESTTTVENNVATVSGTSGAIKIEVSDVDLSAVHLALQYKATGVTGIETVVYGNGDEAAWPAVIMPKGFNVTETIVGDMVIATADITSEVASFTGLTTVRFNITCEENATLEVLNFAITTDGNHGFEIPEDPVVPVTGVFNAVSGATGTDNSFTMTSSTAEIRTPLSITDLSSLFFSVKFTQTGLEGFDVRLSGKNSAGEVIVDEAIVYKLMMDPTVKVPWTVNAYDVYGSFAVATFNPGNYLTAKDFVVVDSITFYLRGATGVTFEILDFAVTADGNHGFELPSILDFTVSDKTVDYTGNAVELEVVCEQEVEFTFEYAVKAETLEWLTGTPTDVGEYLVRVTYAGDEYTAEPVEVTVVINKIASTVTEGDVVVDPHTRIVTVKDGIEASLDEEFIEGEEVYSGDDVPYGAVIYYRHAADKNHLASEALQVKVSRPTWGNPIVTKEPTCTEAGSQTLSCTSCADCGQTKVEEIPALGHKHEWSHDEEGHIGLCACGDKTEKEAHKGGKATFTEKAVCDVCGASYGEVLNSVVTIYFQNNWNWSDVCFYAWNDKGNIGEWPGEKLEPVGTIDGKDLYAIQLNIAKYQNFIINGWDKGGNYRNQTKDLVALDYYDAYATDIFYMEHNSSGNYNYIKHFTPAEGDVHFHKLEVSKYDETHHWLECACGLAGEKVEHAHGEYSEVSAATCTEAQVLKAVCSCGHEVTKEGIAALGHTEVVDAAVAATCTEAGLTEGKHCSVCNAVLVAQESVAAKGHTEVVDAAVAATCTSKGKTEGKHCSECNAVLVAQQDVDMLEHADADSNNACDSCGKELGGTTPEPKPTPSTNGCGGSILASIFGLLTLAGATIVLRKKREE